jgi:hypothetical protein
MAERYTGIPALNSANIRHQPGNERVPPHHGE